ncbi:hypothetical protein OBP_129 [Pseudomonas phage OBP]|uniref:hypothetical protein n=1 Tax=Pseudomonas phage OBP TaxID=1124849 RepID=UPI000240D4AF|nr:hypothetical protein OBP_129 [Pseudomonas phage OBP]AEV89566.1 hypothetical protein OBP_129 [Pseudomonas phage OBP]
MSGPEDFEDYLAANPNASYSELQSKMEEILNTEGGDRGEMEEMLDEHFEDYQSSPEDFEDEL